MFVNLKGEPVDTTPVKQKKATIGGPKEYHKGWAAKGYSPQQIEAGMSRHHESEAAARSAGTPAPPPWSEGLFMRQTKPKKIRPAPYELRDAAVQCCEMAEKAGWKGCRVEPVAKGGK